MAEEGTGAYLTLAVESLEAEVESLRETNGMLDLARRDQKTRAEAAEAKLAEVEKERDYWREENELGASRLTVLRASLDRARELAKADTEGPGVFLDQRLERIARLLSGDE